MHSAFSFFLLGPRPSNEATTLRGKSLSPQLILSINVLKDAPKVCSSNLSGILNPIKVTKKKHLVGVVRCRPWSMVR